jgi:Ca2+-binding RTX toxin-like protein
VRVDLRLSAPQNTNGAGTDTLSGFENLTGSDFNDTLIGTNGTNVLRGGLGSDVLLGLGGDDILIGGAGAANTLQGGLGDDVYVVEAADTIVELAGQGRDRVETTRNVYSLSANVEDLTFTGTGNFTGYGNASDNVITGGAGDDLLIGGAGADTLSGGLGSDTVVYAAAGGGVTANLATGVASNDGDGSSDVLTSIENLTGSAFDDTLTGGAGVNYLISGAGDDVINGRGGNDWLYGGDGEDTVSYADATAGVAVHLYARTAQDGEGGMDVITGFENVTGSDFNDLLVGDENGNELRGGAGRDVLLGREGSDRLYGGSGAANQLQGGAGDDVYYVDANDTIVELAGEGHDYVVTTMNVFTLSANVEDLQFDGTGNFVGAGNASDNEIYGGAGDDILNGGAGQDGLNGGEGTDILLGGDGDDYLDGGWDSVRDILIGGAGDDTYILRTGDAVVEAIGGGYDTAQVLGDYTLAAGVELEVMTANAASSEYNTTIVGNELANTIIGGQGDNVLRGMAGNDRLNGGYGADRLEGGDGDDVLIGGYGDDRLFGGAGTDTAWMSYDRSQYTLVDLGAGRYSITHNSPDQEGVDILEGIEQVRFSNGTFSVASLFAAGAPAIDAKADVGPQTLPTMDDDFLPVGGHAAMPLVLPAMYDAEGFGDPLILPGLDQDASSLFHAQGGVFSGILHDDSLMSASTPGHNAWLV